MRAIRATLLALLVLAGAGLLLSTAPGQDIPFAGPPVLVDPILPKLAPPASAVEKIARDALAHLRSLPQDDRYHTRYVSFHQMSAADAREAMTLLTFLCNHATFAKTPPAIQPAAIGEGKLAAIDLRQWRWSREAWDAVAARDRYMIQPLVSNYVAQKLREEIGSALDPALAKSFHYPVMAIVSGQQLIRDIMETNRSTTYYDLLFSRQRFGGAVVKTVKKPYVHRGGDLLHPFTKKLIKNLAPGEYWYDAEERVATAKAVDFPKDEKDWLDAFGVEVNRKFLEQVGVALDQGAVVPGRDNDEKGSIVSKKDRALLFDRGPLGTVTQSFDFISNTKGRDPVERGPEFATKPSAFNADAHEYINQLPGGAFAGFLTNKDKKRIERGDTEVVAFHEKLDPRYPDVRNIMGCVVCHAPDNGYVRPRNLIEEFTKSGVDLKIKDKERLERYREFFIEWDSQIADMRLPYARMLGRLPREKDGKARTGVGMVKLLFKYRDGYDRALTPAMAAAELGVPEEKMKLVLGTLSPSARLNWLVLGRPMPRDLWESEHYLESAKLLSPGVTKLLDLAP